MDIFKIIKKISLLHSVSTETPTCYKLTKKLIHALPIDWSNSDLRILDPACGRGNFLLAIVEILQQHGHSNITIANMIYGCDINKVQSSIAKKCLFLALGMEPRVYCEDSLTKVWDMKFDIVIGNPPYDKEGEGRAEKLWPKFVEKSFEFLKEGGYCALVTPTSWTSGSKNIRKGSTGVLHDVFHKWDVKHVDLDCSKYFPSVSVPIGYFVAQKIPNTGNTTLGGMNINLRNFDILPSNLENFIPMTGILDKVFKAKTFEVHSFTGAGAKRNTGEDEPTASKTVKTYVRGGNLHTVYYAYFDSVLNPKCADKRKVVMPISGAEKWMPFVDTIGVPICLSSYVIYLADTDTYDGVISVFNSKLFKFLIEKYRTSGFAQVAILKKIPHFDMSRIWTDVEIYAKMNLIPEEIDLIEVSIK